MFLLYISCHNCHHARSFSFRYIPDDCESYGRTDDDASVLVTDDGESYIGTNDGSRALTDDDDSELYDNHPKVIKILPLLYFITFSVLFRFTRIN